MRLWRGRANSCLPHSLADVGRQPAPLVIEVRPALGMEGLLRTAAVISSRPASAWFRAPLDLVLFLGEFERGLGLPYLPIWLGRAVPTVRLTDAAGSRVEEMVEAGYTLSLRLNRQEEPTGRAPRRSGGCPDHTALAAPQTSLTRCPPRPALDGPPLPIQGQPRGTLASLLPQGLTGDGVLGTRPPRPGASKRGSPSENGSISTAPHLGPHPASPRRYRCARWGGWGRGPPPVALGTPDQGGGASGRAPAGGDGAAAGRASRCWSQTHPRSGASSSPVGSGWWRLLGCRRQLSEKVGPDRGGPVVGRW